MFVSLLGALSVENMTTAPLAKSSPKSELMRRLGLSGPAGEGVYEELYVSLYSKCGVERPLADRLQKEAVKGRDALSSNREVLSPPARQRGTPVPYRWDDIQETYRYWQRLDIVAKAVPKTGPYYRMGEYGTVARDNWVAEWFLWHSFRYRDNRASVSSAAAPQANAPDPRGE